MSVVNSIVRAVLFGIAADVLIKGSIISTRYFRRNEGSTDYATIPEVTLAGDQRFEFDLLTTMSSGVGVIISGQSSVDRWYAAVENGKPLIGNGTDRVAGTLTVNDGVFHHWVFEVASNILTVTVDNLVQYNDVVKATLPKAIINAMADESGEFIASGILPNLKIYDNGTLIRDYPLNDNSSTIRDLANGQDGTIINGNADDWGLFDKQANGDWLGQELLFNGDFSQGASGWGGPVAETVFADNKLYYNGTTNNVIYQNSISNTGVYLVTADIDSFTRNSTTPRPRFQVVGNGGYQPITTGVAGIGSIYYEVGDANNGIGYFELGGFGTGAEFVVNSFSVKEVLKNA